MVVISFNQFNIEAVNFHPARRKRGNPKGNKKVYAKEICAFDIETSRIGDNSIMYLWQFAIDDLVIYGRFWSEFFAFLRILKNKLNGLNLVIWDFNASYEFQFIKGWYAFDEDEVFAIDNRKVLKFEMFETFEFRCAYIHTNMTLRRFLQKMDVEIQKSELNYNEFRTPFDVLPFEVLDYGARDVAGLTEAMAKEFEQENKNVYDIPLTSTGFVREDVKHAMRNVPRETLVEIFPELEIMLLLKKAFRGGDVHANRYFAGDIVENVFSKDISSSYPAVLCLYEFPMAKFKRRDVRTINDLEKQIEKNRACLVEVYFENIRERDPYKARPYFASHKCQILKDAIIDNGRVMSASELITVFTDVDFEIIKDCYVWDSARVIECYTSKYDYLPEELTDVIKGLYQKKTALKGTEDTYFYHRAKEKLNACYGMLAQSVLRYDTKFRDNAFVEDEPDFAEQIEKHKRRGFLSYAWGVWCTAYARRQLFRGMKIVEENPENDLIYWDTDSVKYIGIADFSKFNNEIKELSKERDCIGIDAQGKKHYMGVFEDDGEYDEFKTLGAKKYVYTDSDGLHITIAGVSKKDGAKELKSIDNFKDGFIFKNAGGLESLYNDNVDIVLDVGGQKIRCRDNLCLRESTYTIGLSADYERLLNGIFKPKYLPFGDINKLFK